MSHEYVKEFETFNTTRNGTVPKPTAAEVTGGCVLGASGAWVPQSGGGGGTTILLKAPIYVNNGGHYNASGTRFTYANTQSSPFPNGASAFSAEIFYHAYKANAGIDPYLISIGSDAYHQAFGIAIKRIVTFADDFEAYDETAYGLHHKVITYDGNVTLKMYLDGVLFDTHTIGAALNLQPLQVGLGCWLDGAEPLTGDIYFIRFYAEELTAGNVLSLYNQRGL